MNIPQCFLNHQSEATNEPNIPLVFIIKLTKINKKKKMRASWEGKRNSYRKILWVRKKETKTIGKFYGSERKKQRRLETSEFSEDETIASPSYQVRKAVAE